MPREYLPGASVLQIALTWPFHHQPRDLGQGTARLTLTFPTWPHRVTWGSRVAFRAPPWALPGDRLVAGGRRGMTGEPPKRAGGPCRAEARSLTGSHVQADRRCRRRPPPRPALARQPRKEPRKDTHPPLQASEARPSVAAADGTTAPSRSAVAGRNGTRQRRSQRSRPSLVLPPLRDSYPSNTQIDYQATSMKIKHSNTVTRRSRGTQAPGPPASASPSLRLRLPASH